MISYIRYINCIYIELRYIRKERTKFLGNQHIASVQAGLKSEHTGSARSNVGHGPHRQIRPIHSSSLVNKSQISIKMNVSDITNKWRDVVMTIKTNKWVDMVIK